MKLSNKPVKASGSTFRVTRAATVCSAGKPQAATCRNVVKPLSLSVVHEDEDLANHHTQRQTHLKKIRYLKMTTYECMQDERNVYGFYENALIVLVLVSQVVMIQEGR